MHKSFLVRILTILIGISFSLTNLCIGQTCDPCYAIVNGGNWSDPNTWSDTPGGSATTNTPGNTTDVHIGESGAIIVNLDVDSDSDNLTIYGNSVLQYTAAGLRLRTRGGSTLDLQANGTIDGNGQNNADITVRGNFILNGSASDIRRIQTNSGNDITLSGSGTLGMNAGNGELRITGTGTVTNNISTAISMVRLRLNSDANLFVNNGNIQCTELRLYGTNGVLTNNGTLTITSQIVSNNDTDDGNTLTNTNTLSLTGNFNMSNADFSVNNSGAFTHTGDFLNVGGTENFSNLTGGVWTTTATSHANIATINCSATNNSFIYNLAGDQVVFAPSDGSYNNLTISGSGTKTITGAIQIDNTLDMTSGNVDLGTFSLTLGTAAATPGSLNYTSGNLFNGSFIRYYDAVTLANGDVAGLFPMADANGNTRPFYVTPATAPATGGIITVSVTTSDQAVDIGPIDDNGTDIVRQHQASWNVSTGGGLAGGDNYNLRGEGTGFGTIDAVSDLRLMTSGGVVGTDGGAGGSTSNPSVDRTGLTLAQLTNSFHLGSINATDSPLPIKLLSFDAKFEMDQVQVQWSTSSETDNDYFTIERSSDGIEYYEITRIDGAGHSTEKLTYTYADFSPLSGESYYRLRQTDFDGKTEVFTPVSVQALFNSSISIYPNPLTGHQFNIQLNQRSEQPTLVSIYDHTGKSVSFQSIEEETSLAVSLSERLNSGVYLIFVQSGSTTFNQRLQVH
ncbi:T9SS type A sorting domain-containing protein [Reichenbachiella sp.]